MNRDEIDSIYIRHQSDSLNNAHSRTLPFLSYAITINLAFVGAVFLEKINNHLGVLTSIMTLVNFAFFFINYREQRINRILSDSFYRGFAKNCTEGVLDTFKRHIEGNDTLRGWTGRTFLILYSFMLSLPTFAYLELRGKIRSEYLLELLCLVVLWSISNGWFAHEMADLIFNNSESKFERNIKKVKRQSLILITAGLYTGVIISIIIAIIKYG